MGPIFATAIFLLMGSVLVKPLWRAGWSIEALYLLPIPILLVIGYVIAVYMCLWEAFGKEEIVVDGSALRWTCKVARWKEELEIPLGEISDVKAVTPWHGDNRVELVTKTHCYSVGNRMLRDEAIKMAHTLRRAVNLG